MHIYLTTYEQYQDDQQPLGFVYVPKGIDGSIDWSAIDFRPDSKSAEGLCFLAVPERDDSVFGGDYLGDDATITLSQSACNRLGNAFGVNLDASNIPEILLELLRDHADDGRVDRWNELRPTRDTWQVWLHDLLIEVPVVSGGATYTDDFNRANSTSLGSSWDEVGGTGLSINTNRIIRDTASGWARYVGDHVRSDNYAFCTYVYITDVASNLAGPACRFVSDATTCYYIDQIPGPSGGAHRRMKVVAGTTTQLAQNSPYGTNNDVLKIEAYGSSISSYVNGTLVATSTDTAITTGVRSGLRLAANGTGRIALDDWEGGDIEFLYPKTIFYMKI